MRTEVLVFGLVGTVTMAAIVAIWGLDTLAEVIGGLVFVTATFEVGKWAFDSIGKRALDSKSESTLWLDRIVAHTPEAIPSAAIPSKAIREQLAQPQEQTRTIDATLHAGQFHPGDVATLTIVIRAPESQARGRWQSHAKIEVDKGPIRVRVETHGFEVISQPPPPIVVPADRDTPLIAFELRILEAKERWIHVFLTQDGTQVGDLVINDFSPFITALTPHSAHAATSFRPLAEPDLTLSVRTGDERIVVNSPRNRLCLSDVTIAGFKPPIEPFGAMLRERLRALYKHSADAEETERDLKAYGVILSESLPSDLRNYLKRPEIRTLMIKHEENFEFPIELCYLDDDRDPFFVGDRIAVCRWYMGVTNPPDVFEKRISKAAFLRGSDDAYNADEKLLKKLYRTVPLSRLADVREKLFKTKEFQLIHFTGHCRVDENGEGGLELADGKFLRLIDIGLLKEESVFKEARPFVMINACASGQPYVALTNRDSFPHRFVMSQACAVLGTLWPISGPVANEFSRLFYRELHRRPIGQALLAAKKALARRNIRDVVSRRDHRLAREIAIRSYCLFANPDLRVFPML